MSILSCYFICPIIFWDSRFDFDKADIGIYTYAGILSWNCSAYTPGLYFIVVRHGDASRLIPIVVNR